MTMDFNTLLDKLDSHFSKNITDEDIVCIKEVLPNPNTSLPIVKVKNERQTNDQLLESDEDEDEYDSDICAEVCQFVQQLQNKPPHVQEEQVAQEEQQSSQKSKRKSNILEEMENKRAKLQNELRILDQSYSIQKKIDDETAKLEVYKQNVSSSDAIIRELNSQLLSIV